LNGDMLKDYQEKNSKALEKKWKTILDLKQALNAQLGLSLEENNTFDTDTLKALLWFQRKSRLPLSGVCDTKTQKSLFHFSKTVTSSQTSLDEIASQMVPIWVERKNQRYLANDGKSISDLKNQLNDELGLNLPDNNDFDGQTYWALKAFQRKHNLEPDGMCGKNTKQILFEDSLWAIMRRWYGRLKSSVDRISWSILSLPAEFIDRVPQCSGTARRNLSNLWVSDVPQWKSALDSLSMYPKSKVVPMDYLKNSDAKVADVFLDGSRKYKNAWHRVVAVNLSTTSAPEWAVLDPYYAKKVPWHSGSEREPIWLDDYVNYQQWLWKKFRWVILYS